MTTRLKLRLAGTLLIAYGLPGFMQNPNWFDFTSLMLLAGGVTFGLKALEDLIVPR